MQTQPALAIETEQLSRKFGQFVAVQELNLHVTPGQVFGFLGPNGAGKSTTIKLLTGLLPPTSGRVKLAGFDVQKQDLEVKKRIGVVPDTLNLYEHLTTTENLELVGHLYSIKQSEMKHRIPSLLKALELESAAHQIVLKHSSGMRKKTAIACALIHTPEVIFLDEPFENIDPIAAHAIKRILQEMVRQRGITVFFSTHIMELAEQLCSQVAIIHKGRLVGMGAIPALRAEQGLDEHISLEELFVHMVGAQVNTNPLDWLAPKDASHVA